MTMQALFSGQVRNNTLKCLLNVFPVMLKVLINNADDDMMVEYINRTKRRDRYAEFANSTISHHFTRLNPCYTVHN